MLPGWAVVAVALGYIGLLFIVASSLDEAAALAAANPCMQCGLFYEIRPVDPEKASAFIRTTETPGREGS